MQVVTRIGICLQSLLRLNVSHNSLSNFFYDAG